MFLKYRAAAARASADRDHPAVGAGRVRRIVTAIGLGMSLAVPAPAMADEASFAAHDSLTSQHWDGTGTGSYTFDDPSVGRRASISIIGGSLPIITLDSSMQGGAAFFDNYSDFAMSARYRYNVYVLGRTASETAALNQALVGADTNQVIGSAKGSYKLSANRNASIAQVQLSSRTQSLYATISNGTFWGTGRADELNSYSLDLRANDYVFCRDIGCTDTPAIELSMFAFTRMFVDLDLETGGVKGGHTYAFIDPMIELNRDFFLASGLDPDAYSLSLIPTLEATVPEPKGWAMMLLGFGGLGLTLRRRVRVGASVRFA